MTLQTFPFPKTIHVTMAGEEAINLAFLTNEGVFDVLEPQHVPSVLSVEVVNFFANKKPDMVGGPMAKVVEIKAKKLLTQPAGFTLLHQTKPEAPPELITVTVQQLLLEK